MNKPSEDNNQHIFISDQDLLSVIKEFFYHDFSLATIFTFILILPPTFSGRIKFINVSIVILVILLLVAILISVYFYKKKYKLKNFISFSKQEITYRCAYEINIKTIKWEDVLCILPVYSSMQINEAHSFQKSPYELGIKIYKKSRFSLPRRIIIFNNDFDNALKFYNLTEYCANNINYKDIRRQ